MTVKCAGLDSIQTCTLDGHLHRVTCTRCRINTIDSPDNEHRGARNMYRIGINIYEKRIKRQVGYLQELNRDARPTEHKKNSPWYGEVQLGERAEGRGEWCRLER